MLGEKHLTPLQSSVSQTGYIESLK